QHFASYGFLVAAPTFPNTLTPNAQTDAGIIAALVKLLAARPDADPSRVGLEGHSAGGLATVLAAEGLRPGAVVLFDPVDMNGAGQTKYAQLCEPLLGIFADPSACNDDAGWSGFSGT